jgi:hypothetical protein
LLQFCVLDVVVPLAVLLSVSLPAASLQRSFIPFRIGRAVGGVRIDGAVVDAICATAVAGSCRGAGAGGCAAPGIAATGRRDIGDDGRRQARSPADAAVPPRDDLDPSPSLSIIENGLDSFKAARSCGPLGPAAHAATDFLRSIQVLRNNRPKAGFS